MECRADAAHAARGSDVDEGARRGTQGHEISIEIGVPPVREARKQGKHSNCAE